MVYKHETGVLFVEGFAEKFLFSFQAQSCPRLFRTLPLTLLRQTAAYKYFHFFLKSCLQSLCVFNCRGTVFLTNPTVCLKSVFRPKNSFSWASSQVLHKLTAVVGKVLPFEAVFLELVWWLLCKLCNHPHSKLFWLVA